MASHDAEPAAMARLDDAPSDRERFNVGQKGPALPYGDDTGDWDVARAYLASLRRLERLHLRRRAAFKAREGGKATDRVFILSDDRPWTTFAREMRLQWRKWAFETCGTLQWPALHTASCAGDLEAVKKALSTRQKRASACQTPLLRGLECGLRRDACGRTALHHAAVCERWEVVKWLLKCPDAPLQLRAADDSHRTPAHYSLEKMERIALRHPCRPVGASVSSVTVAMRESCPRYRRLWRTVDRMLVRMNTLVIPRPNKQRQGVETVEQLDLRCRGDLWDACRAGDVKRLEFLMRMYFSATSPSDTDVVLGELCWSLLHEACSRSHAAVVHFLLTHERMSCFRESKLLLLQDTSGSTALHYASRRQALDVCALLVDECVDFGESNRDDFVSMGDALALTQDTCGRTALHWCLMAPAAITPDSDAGCGSLAVVAKFLAQKCPASLHVRDCDGMTPLHLAVWRGDAELVQCFLGLGADADGACTPQLINRDEGESCAPTKAPWAPCGLLFQQRKKVESLSEREEDKNDKEGQEISSSNTTSSDQQQTRSVSSPRQSSLHLFECPGITGCDDDDNSSAVYYWIRRMTARRCAATTPHASKMARVAANLRSPCRPAVGGGESDQALDVIGCLKYGGSCDQCRLAPRDRNPSSPPAGYRMPLPPLILALRVCSRVAVSELLDRATILELLLASGAQPDGVVSVDNDSSAGGSLVPFYSLLEALGTGHMSLVHMMLKYGATRLNMDCLERYCSVDWGVETLESMLSPLVLLPDVNERSDTFIAVLFVNKCFNMLSQAIDSSLWTEQRSAWRVILRHLEASRRWQNASKRDPLVDRDHLEFLSRAAEYSSHLAHEVTNSLSEVGMAVKEEPTVANNFDIIALTELIEFCVGNCLRSQAHTKACCSRESAADFDADDATIMICIRHLLSVRVGSVRFEQIIACGFFQTATMVLEAQLGLVQHQFSLDEIFRAFETGIRRLVHLGVAAEKHNTDDFLCVWLSKLLLQQCAPSVVTVTLRSVVYACANNLPIRLVKRCLELVMVTQLDAGSQEVECLVEAMKTMRVRGMRLEQWLVRHRRIDMIHAVFRIICKTSQSTWHFWRELMTATVASRVMSKANEDDTERYQKWTAELLSLPSTLEVMVSTFEEFAFDTLEWLFLERIVPTDCEQMMNAVLPRILELNQQRVVSKLEGDGAELTSSGFADEEVASKHHQWFSQTRSVYLCARWNAMRVLAHVIEAVRVAFREEDAKKWLSETASRVDAVDACSAIEIARLMGHLQIYHALTAPSPSSQPPSCGSEPSLDSTHAGSQDDEGGAVKDSDKATQKSWSNRNFGFLRAVLASHERIASSVPTSASVASITSPTRQYFAAPSISDDLEIVCRSNRVHHLAILMDLLPFTAETAALNSQLLGRFVLTACANGAIDALSLLLSTFNPSSLTEVDSNACVHLVARQMTGQGGDVFVEILLLLLEHSFPPGRLAGDGGEITILHRAACVHNALFAQRIITRILAIEDCDSNVLDSHGNTPVVYALASGRMENACFLMQHTSCRLEAEYEGQACFYYALHLVPNPSARKIVKDLLRAKRAHAFLHCEADLGACACKSFEISAGGNELCNFCDHAKPLHTVLPLPSWFRDQYDTYIDGRLVCQAKPEQDDDDDDYNGNCRDDGYALNESPDAVSDEDLENARGRLDNDALGRLALIRYDPIVSDFGLEAAFRSLESSPSPSEDADAMSDSEMAVSAWTMVDLHVLDVCESQADSSVAHSEAAEVHNDELEQLIQPSGMDPTNRKLTTQLPWFIRTDVGMLHPPNCVCQRLEFVTTLQMLLHLAVCRWLRFTVAKAFGHNWQVRHAFTSWRFATERVDRVLPPPQPIVAVESSPIDNTTDQRRARMLKRAVIAHWRLGLRALTAFRAWKQRSMSPELVHHALEDAALDISTDMRRSRLETLRVRQLQVQQAARAVTSQF